MLVSPRPTRGIAFGASPTGIDVGSASLRRAREQRMQDGAPAPPAFALGILREGWK
jgi:hypothetical protein